MSLSGAVTAHFKLIVRNKCTPDARWNAGCVFHLSTAVFGYLLILVVALCGIPMMYNILKFKHDKQIINRRYIGLMAVLASNDVAYAVNNHLHISTWGEGIIQLIQCLIVMNILFIHEGQHRQAVAFTLVYVIAMVGSLTPLVPQRWIILLKVLNIMLDIARKTYIVYRCYRLGTPVSPVASRRSVFLLNMCSFGRCLTAYVHSHDWLLILSYVLESFSTLVLTIVAIVVKRQSKKKKELSITKNKNDDYDDGGDDDDDDVVVDNNNIIDDELKRGNHQSSLYDYCGDMSSGCSSCCSGDEMSCYSYDSKKRRRKMRTRKTISNRMTEEDDHLSYSYSSSSMEDSIHSDSMATERRRIRVMKSWCNRWRKEGDCDKTRSELSSGNSSQEELDPSTLLRRKVGLIMHEKSVKR